MNKRQLSALLLVVLLVAGPKVIKPDDTFCTKSWQKVYLNDYIGGALQNNGSLVTWGVNQFGGLGTAPAGATQSTPIQVYASYANWIQIAMNLYYTIGLGLDHAVYGWGMNTYGNLGNIVSLGGIKATADAGSNITSLGLCKYVATHGLAYTTYAIQDCGKLLGLGENFHGQLGVPTASKASSSTPVQINGDSDWASVFPAKRDSHVCGLKSNGNLYCWGENYFKQVGDNSMVDHPVPYLIGTCYDSWISVHPQLGFTIALHSNGTLWGWGTTYLGIFANGQDYSQLGVPTQIACGMTFKAVAVHDNYLIAITSDGKLWGWGENRYTQVNSNAAVGIQNVPNKISNDNDWAKVFVSVGVQMNAIGSAFAIKVCGSLFAWGSNDVGQLGLGSAAVTVNVPTQVMPPKSFKDVTSVGYVTAIIDDKDEVFLAGFNNFNLLGDGTINTSNAFHSCANPAQTCSNHVCSARLRF